MKHYMVQLENCRAVFVNAEEAKSPEEAITVARAKLGTTEAQNARHIRTEVFAGQTLSEVING